MKIKNLTVILFIAIFAMNAHSQNEYVLVGDYQESLKNVYKVRKKTIKTQRYEYKTIDNVEYIKINHEIDSLEKVRNLINAKIYLAEELKNKKSDPFNSNNQRWLNIKKAKQYLDKSGGAYEQNIQGKYKVAINQAKVNIQKIEDQLPKSVNSSSLTGQINKLKAKLNRSDSYGYEVPRTISDFFPVEDIEREIIYIDTTNSVTTLTGILLPFEDTYLYKDGYKFVSKDFRSLVKGEFVSKNDFKKINPRNEVGVAEPIHYIGYIFQNKESGDLYISDKKFWKKYAKSKELNEVYLFLEKSGAKYYTDYGKYNTGRGITYVEYKGHKCILDGIIKNALINKDISVIEKMSNSVAEHKRMKDQASILANKMADYYSAYKSKLLTLDERNKWKATTTKCDNLLKKMRKLPYATESEYYTQVNDENKEGNSLSDIIDMVTLSKQTLGM